MIKGKKRHVLVDTQGLLLRGLVTAADVQDRDGGLVLLASLFGLFPFLTKLFADSAYQGPVFQLAGIQPQLETEIVKRSDRAKGFVVLPKRWIVERSIAWLNRCRRLAKDWENLNRNALGIDPPHAPKTLNPSKVSKGCNELPPFRWHKSNLSLACIQSNE